MDKEGWGWTGLEADFPDDNAELLRIRSFLVSPKDVSQKCVMAEVQISCLPAVPIQISWQFEWWLYDKFKSCVLQMDAPPLANRSVHGFLTITMALWENRTPTMPAISNWLNCPCRIMTNNPVHTHIYLQSTQSGLIDIMLGSQPIAAWWRCSAHYRFRKGSLGVMAHMWQLTYACRLDTAATIDTSKRR